MSDAVSLPPLSIIYTQIVALPDDTDVASFDLEAWVAERQARGEVVAEAMVVAPVDVSFAPDELEDLFNLADDYDIDGGGEGY